MAESAAEPRARPDFPVRRLRQISVAIFKDEMASLEISPIPYGALMIAANPGIDLSAFAVEPGGRCDV